MAVDVILIGNATFCQCVYVIEKTFCHFSALFSLSRLIALSVSVQNTLNMIYTAKNNNAMSKQVDSKVKERVFIN